MSRKSKESIHGRELIRTYKMGNRGKRVGGGAKNERVGGITGPIVRAKDVKRRRG